MGHAWGKRPHLPLLGLTLVRANTEKLFQVCKYPVSSTYPSLFSAPHAPHFVFCKDIFSTFSPANEVPNG